MEHASFVPQLWDPYLWETETSPQMYGLKREATYYSTLANRTPETKPHDS